MARAEAKRCDAAPRPQEQPPYYNAASANETWVEGDPMSGDAKVSESVDAEAGESEDAAASTRGARMQNLEEARQGDA